MNVLILGGSIFIGQHFANYAASQGHTVTVFNRGKQKPSLSPSILQLIGDRHSDLSAIKNTDWDVVIDSSGYLPSAVEATCQLFQNRILHYVYVSSLSVYEKFDASIDERSEVATLTSKDVEQAELLPKDDSPTALTYGAHYGGLKATCEDTVKKYFPNNHIIVRPGVVVGSYDYSNRLVYWIEKIKSSERYLAPGSPETPTRFIDVRDLVKFTFQQINDVGNGIFNLPGPKICFGQLVSGISDTLTNKSEPIWIDESFLLENNVQPWSEIPLWLNKNLQNFFTIDDAKARKNGLDYCSIADTISTVSQWLDTTNPTYRINAGLPLEREQALIKKWLSTTSK